MARHVRADSSGVTADCRMRVNAERRIPAGASVVDSTSTGAAEHSIQ